MLLFAQLAAALGLLLPVVLFVGLRSTQKTRQPWEIALDIPLAVSLDLMVVLTLTLFMRLEIATLVARALYLLVAVGIVGRRLRPIARWPAALGWREVARLGVAVVAGLSTSVWLSRTWMIWDRGWHIPLSGSLRGQKLPFHNVFNAHEVLHYHFSGDVTAAMLQVLSRGVLHTTIALSLMHDLHFALIALVIALFMTGWGYKSVAWFVLGPLALLLSGPMHIFRGNIRTPQEGHNFVSFLSFSFRPHTALGALLIVGFLGAVLARLGERDDLPLGKTAPALWACAAGLAITEETSLGTIGLSLGLTWLFAPRVIHPRRLYGVLVFAGLAVALIGPNLAFSAALAPGGEPHHFSVVPWRSPGYYRPVLPLSTPVGRLMLGYDLCGPGAVLVGGVAHVLRRRGRGRGVLMALYAILFVVSTVLLTRIDFDGRASESHRFATSLFIAGPFVALALLAGRFPAAGTPAPRAPYATAGIIAGLTAAAASTLDWGIYYAPSWATPPDAFAPMYNLYASNCLTWVGDHRWAEPRYTYVTRPLYYLITGCMPTYTPGYGNDSAWQAITIGLPYEEGKAIAALRKELPPGSPITLECAKDTGLRDSVCALAQASGTCRPTGGQVKECTLSAEQAAAYPEK